jgi:hypothetical protein
MLSYSYIVVFLIWIQFYVDQYYMNCYDIIRVLLLG